MGRQVRPVADGEADRALQLGPDGEQRDRRGHRQAQRCRCVAAGPAQHRESVGEPAHDAVVGPTPDRSVVGEQGVGDAAEPAPGVVVVDRHRLVGAVPAGEHDRFPDGADEQVVQARRGQEQTEFAPARRHRTGDGGIGPTMEQHDRRLRTAQRCRLGVVDVAQRPGRREVRHEHRERLVLAMLAGPQAGDRALVGGTNREVIAADALDRHDRASAEQSRRPFDRIVALGRARRTGHHTIGGDHAVGDDRAGDHTAVGVHQDELRAARRAADGFGVEPPVGRVLVFAAAGWAEREARHCRGRAVVGKVAHDAVAGATGRAVHERMTEPAVRWIGQLGEAVSTGGDVRWDLGPTDARRAGSHGEPRVLHDDQLTILHDDGVHPRQGRCFVPQRAEEPAHGGGVALHLDVDTTRVVVDPTAELLARRQPPHERPEADALHDAAHVHGDATLHCCGQS